MSYGPIQRQSVRRPAGPYERPRKAPSARSYQTESSSPAPFWSRIFQSVKGLLSFSHNDDNAVSEFPEENVESPAPINDQIERPAEPRSPPLQWQGVSVDEMPYGELRRICMEEGLRVSEDRDSMLNELRQHIVSQQNRRRPEGQNKRRLSGDDTNLEQVMMKKAKVGFSKDEFEKYMALMKDNLKINDGDGFGKFSPGSMTPSNNARELRRQSLPKRVPTPFAHLSSRRPSRRDSLTGGSIGPIHISFPSTVTSTEDIHDLSKSSKTARSILSSISSMSTPLIQSNEVLAKKRLQPRRPFNPYAQVGPPPSKPAFKMQPPVLKPSDEPVKASHELNDIGGPKRRRQDDVRAPSSSPPTFKPQPAATQKPAPESFKPAPTADSSKTTSASFEPPKFSFQAPSASKPAPAPPAKVAAVPKSAPAPVPVSAPAASTEEAVCPVCEMGMDDVDHSECQTSESSPSHKPSAAPSSGFSFGNLPATSDAAGFSFQLPKFPETAQKDSAPNFSFAPPKPSEQAPKFDFAAPASKDAQAVSQPTAAPSSPTKFSFGMPAKIDEPAPEQNRTELNPSSDALFKPSSTGFSFGSSVAIKVPSLESQAKKPAADSPNALATSSAPAFSFGLQKSTVTPSQPESTASKPAEPLKPFTFSSDSTQFKFGAATESKPDTAPASVSTGFNFGTPAVTTSAAATPVVDLTKDSPPTSAPSGTGFKFDLKPQESVQIPPSGTTSSVKPFQFGTLSSQPAGGFGSSAAATPSSTTAAPSTPFQFGNTATAPSTLGATTQPAFQFGSATPAPSAPSSTPSFSFGTGTSATPAPASSTGFSFGTSDTTSTSNPPSTPLKFSLADTKTTSTPAPSFSFGGSNMTAMQSPNAMEVQSSNNAPSTSAPGFSFGSNVSTPGVGFGQNSAQTGSVFGQATPSTGSVFGQAPPSAPSVGFGFGSDANKPANTMDGFQSGSGFGFGQAAAPSTPAPTFSFGSSAPSTASFPGAINFDNPVPENLGGSFSHGMAPQGRPMVKAKRVARKR